VLVEILLEIEVGELLSLRDLEELAERTIRLDVVLDLEVVGLDIVVELLGDVGAGDQGALGLAEEHAELIGDLGGDLKDGRATLGRLLALSAHAALTTASILDLTVDTLVKALDLSDHRGDSLAERGEGGEDRLEVLIQSGRRRSRGLRGGGRRSSDRRRGRGGNRGGRGSSRLASGLGSSSRGRRGGGGGRGRNGGHNGRNGLIGLLGNTLTLSSGGSNSGAHHTSTGGRIHLN